MKFLIQLVLTIFNMKTILLFNDYDIYGSAVPYIKFDQPICENEDLLCGYTSTSHVFCHPMDRNYANCSRFKLIGMTDELKLQLVSSHNALRNIEAQRVDYEIPNMNKMHWDDKLAEVAEQYVLRCSIYGPTDDCRYIGDRNHSFGVNYYYVKYFSGYSNWVDVAIHSWYNYSSTDDRIPPQFCSKTKYSAFTQVIWPATKYVGCAGARIETGVLFFCCYGPKGNEGYITRSFQHGVPCSECPIGSYCSDVFPALCDYFNCVGIISKQLNPYWMLFIAWWLIVN